MDAARPLHVHKRFWIALTLLLAVAVAIGWALLDQLKEGVAAASAAPADTPTLTLTEPLAPPAEAGELVVLSVPAPTTVLLDGDRPYGYEADLTLAFAEAEGWNVRYELFDTEEAMWTALRDGQGHLAAAGLTPRQASGEPGLRGPAYKNVQVQVVCRRSVPPIRTLSGLKGIPLRVVAGSVHEETLKAARADVPSLTWSPALAPTALPLIEQAAEEGGCAVADSNVIALARTQLVELEVPLSLTSDDRPMAWAVSPRFTELLPAVAAFIDAAHSDDTLDELDERYYGHLARFDYVDLAAFRRRIGTRLPQFEESFRNAAEETLFHWTLLAAQGYQESHWDPAARSPTGVRGIMMLTLPTAREVGIENRLDPEQSIQGGAAYLARLFGRLPEDVTGRDRLWFALAAYNVGYGHLQDARRLARARGEDPDEWHVLDDMLPLLSDPQVYPSLRYGYARGGEPVTYVRRIREYHETLAAEIAGVDGRPPLFLRRPAEG